MTLTRGGVDLRILTFLVAPIIVRSISGFTAWSSRRDPSQVFALLEAVFQSFDRLARARSVLKVETVGDCYGELIFGWGEHTHGVYNLV